MNSDIDNCQPTPCLNNGVCVDGLNSYSCDCTHGFVGENCSTSKLIKIFHIVEFYPQLIKCWNVHILKISDVNDCEGNPCNKSTSLPSPWVMYDNSKSSNFNLFII